VRPRYSVSTAPAASLNESTISATAACFSARAMGLLPMGETSARGPCETKNAPGAGPGRGSHPLLRPKSWVPLCHLRGSSASRSLRSYLRGRYDDRRSLVTGREYGVPRRTTKSGWISVLARMRSRNRFLLHMCHEFRGRRRSGIKTREHAHIDGPRSTVLRNE